MLHYRLSSTHPVSIHDLLITTTALHAAGHQGQPVYYRTRRNTYSSNMSSPHAREREKQTPPPSPLHRGIRRPRLTLFTSTTPSSRRSRTLGRVAIALIALVVLGITANEYLCHTEGCLARTGFQPGSYVGGGSVLGKMVGSGMRGQGKSAEEAAAGHDEYDEQSPVQLSEGQQEELLKMLEGGAGPMVDGREARPEPMGNGMEFAGGTNPMVLHGQGWADASRLRGDVEEGTLIEERILGWEDRGVLQEREPEPEPEHVHVQMGSGKEVVGKGDVGAGMGVGSMQMGAW